MMSQVQLQEQALLETLREIDEEVALEVGVKKRFKVIVVGGSALLLAHATSRPATHDMDILKADEALSAVLARHPEVSDQAEVYTDRLPAGFRKRLVPTSLSTRAVDFLRPCLEDLAVMKLYSWRKQDQTDLLSKDMLLEIDLNLLESLIYDPSEARKSSNTHLLYDRVVETYEKQYKRKATAKKERLIAAQNRKNR